MDDERHDALRLSVAQFRALGHPLRHRIVNVLRQRPATLGQLTSALRSSKGTVGYHLRVLREAGLVRVKETRQVRGGTEEYLDLVSRHFDLDDIEEGGTELLFRSALAEMLPAPPRRENHTELRHLWLTPDEADRLAARLQDRAAEPPSSPDDPQSRAYGLLVSLYPADIPRLPADERDSQDVASRAARTAKHRGVSRDR